MLRKSARNGCGGGAVMIDQVLIAGAGPVGFTVALNLAIRGIPFTLFESSDKIFDDPRAGTIHPPTLEMFSEIGVASKLIEQGYKVESYQYRDRRDGLIAQFNLNVLRDETPYPFRLMLEQHKLCYTLRDMLKSYSGHKILMRHRVVEVDQDAYGVSARIDAPEGLKTFKARWMIGCDGGRSQVRKSMRVEFEGFTYPERFLVLSTRHDFSKDGYAITNYIADPEEWCALFKVPGSNGDGMWRVVFPVDADADPKDIFNESAVQARINNFHKKSGPYDVVHRNLYDVHQRVASRYRDGRLLIAGDAAHINNPLGGMGMNFGLHDAFNLVETLAKVWRNNADEGLLDRYDRQRRTVAQDSLQRQTIENKRNIEQKDPAERERFYNELRDTLADPVKLRSYLMRVAMIEGVRRAKAIQ